MLAIKMRYNNLWWNGTGWTPSQKNARLFKHRPEAGAVCQKLFDEQDVNSRPVDVGNQKGTTQ